MFEVENNVIQAWILHCNKPTLSTVFILMLNDIPINPRENQQYPYEIYSDPLQVLACIRPIWMKPALMTIASCFIIIFDQIPCFDTTLLKEIYSKVRVYQIYIAHDKNILYCRPNLGLKIWIACINSLAHPENRLSSDTLSRTYQLPRYTIPHKSSHPILYSRGKTFLTGNAFIFVQAKIIYGARLVKHGSYSMLLQSVLIPCRI